MRLAHPIRRRLWTPSPALWTPPPLSGPQFASRDFVGGAMGDSFSRSGMPLPAENVGDTLIFVLNVGHDAGPLTPSNVTIAGQSPQLHGVHDRGSQRMIVYTTPRPVGTTFSYSGDDGGAGGEFFHLATAWWTASSLGALRDLDGDADTGGQGPGGSLSTALDLEAGDQIVTMVVPRGDGAVTTVAFDGAEEDFDVSMAAANYSVAGASAVAASTGPHVIGATMAGATLHALQIAAAFAPA